MKKTVTGRVEETIYNKISAYQKAKNCSQSEVVAELILKGLDLIEGDECTLEESFATLERSFRRFQNTFSNNRQSKISCTLSLNNETYKRMLSCKEGLGLSDISQVVEKVMQDDLKVDQKGNKIAMDDDVKAFLEDPFNGVDPVSGETESSVGLDEFEMDLGTDEDFLP